MAYETLTKQRPFVKAKNMKKGDFVEGYVIGDWTSDKYPEHVNLVVSLKNEQTFLVDQKGEGDTVNAVPVVVKAGDNIVLQGAGNLKYFFENKNPLGNLYKFTYEGMIVRRKGRAAGKSSHYFVTQLDRSEMYAGELPKTEADVEAEGLAL